MKLVWSTSGPRLMPLIVRVAIEAAWSLRCELAQRSPRVFAEISEVSDGRRTVLAGSAVAVVRCCSLPSVCRASNALPGGSAGHCEGPLVSTAVNAAVDAAHPNRDLRVGEDERSPLRGPGAAVPGVDACERSSADADPDLALLPVDARALANPS